MWIGWVVIMLPAVVFAGSEMAVGPRFTSEPPTRVLFYNSTGTSIPCVARGTPEPTVTWRGEDGEVPAIRGLVGVRSSDGALMFSPFSPDLYRREVHAGVYRCIATNRAGAVASRDVVVQAVLRASYEIRTYDEFVIRGEVAAFRCIIPSSVKDFVTVMGWETSDGVTIPVGTTQGTIRATLGGLLLVANCTIADSARRYRCVARDELDGETVPASGWGQLIVREPPRAMAPPKIHLPNEQRLEVPAGSSAELSCVSEGGQVHWMKRSAVSGRYSPLLGGFRPVLGGVVFRPVVTQHATTYVCVANNSLGEARAQMSLIVTEPPRAVITPSTLRLREGMTATFTCNTSGTATSVSWLHDARPLQSSARVRLLNSGVLRIHSVRREDRGMYQCFVSSSLLSSAQSAAQLSLEESPPEFLYVFQDTSVHPRFRVSLRCEVRGMPLPRVTWYHYEQKIIEDLNRRLGDFVDGRAVLTSFVNISAVGPEHGGRYTCEASNDAGVARHAARLDVIGPPLVLPMDNITITSSSDLRRECAYSGHPVTRVVWRRVSPSGRLSQKQGDSQNGTLVLYHVSKPDQGWYRCEVEGTRGTKASESFYLKVIEKPSINPFLFGEQLQEGMRAMVVCSVLDGESPLQLSWLKDGVPVSQIHPDARVDQHGEFASSLAFPSLSRSHAGNYTCQARSGPATADYTAPMVVLASPHWVRQPEDSTLLAGKRVVLPCQADGIPEPVHRWKFLSANSQNSGDFKSIVSSSHMYVLENGSLIISEAQREDAGEYLCEASNGVGHPISSIVNLKIKVAPYFNQSFAVVSTRENKESRLICSVYGDQPLALTWSRNRSPISTDGLSRFSVKESLLEGGGHRSELTISRSLKLDSGMYTCEATNQHGREEKNIQLLVQGVPDTPTGLQVTQVSSRSLTLVWTALSPETSDITSFIVVYNQSIPGNPKSETEKRVPPTESKLVVSGLEPTTSYFFKVRAENPLGSSPFSQELFITTEDEAPSLPPTGIALKALSSTSVQVSWKAPREGGSLHQGYYVGHKRQGTSDTFLYKTVENGTETVLRGLRPRTSYVVTVQAFNSKGAGPVAENSLVETLQYDPPEVTNLKVTSATSTTLNIEWTNPENIPVTSYTVRYWTDLGEAAEQRVPGGTSRFSLTNLHCGSKYSVVVTARNPAGEGPSSQPATAHTSGQAPLAAEASAVLGWANSTAMRLRLESWRERGCPVRAWAVRYRPRGGGEWMRPLEPLDSSGILLRDLNPGTWYDILVSARSDAGSTEREYRLATLSIDGGTVPPLTSLSHHPQSPPIRELTILVPIICAIVVVIVITIVISVVIVLRKREASASECHSQDGYSAGSGGKGETVSMADYCAAKSKKSAAEELYYPTPYATTQVEYASPRDHSTGGTLRRERQRGDHQYDVPQRRSARVNEYNPYAKLWTQNQESTNEVAELRPTSSPSRKIYGPEEHSQVYIY